MAKTGQTPVPVAPSYFEGTVRHTLVTTCHKTFAQGGRLDARSSNVRVRRRCRLTDLLRESLNFRVILHVKFTCSKLLHGHL